MSYDSCECERAESLLACLHSLAEAMEFTGNVIFDSSKSDGQFKKTASNAKLVGLYPDFQFTTIKEVFMHELRKLLSLLTLRAQGLRLACSWFVENYEIARKGY